MLNMIGLQSQVDHFLKVHGGKCEIEDCKLDEINVR